MLPLESKILLVEDFESLMAVQTNILNQLGYKNVFGAADGKQAFELLEAKTGEIDCIISDWNMPVMDGLELLKKVRADERFKDLPFLMLTSETEKKGILNAIESGVTNYIVKPATAEVLQDKLGKL